VNFRCIVLLQDFERVEGNRIDSLKMALKKLLSAQEAMLTAQRPLVFAATDMVDAIDREDDVRQYKQELQCATRVSEIEQLLEEQAWFVDFAAHVAWTASVTNTHPLRFHFC